MNSVLHAGHLERTGLRSSGTRSLWSHSGQDRISSLDLATGHQGAGSGSAVPPSEDPGPCGRGSV